MYHLIMLLSLLSLFSRVAQSWTRLKWLSSSSSRQHIKKQRHYFANKGPSPQGYGFSSGHVWMWELDYRKSWESKIDAFELWWWRRLLRVPSTARRSNHSILKETSPECSLEGLMLKLKLQYFCHLMQRTDSLEKTLIVRKTEGGRRRGKQRIRWLNGITNSMYMRLSKPRGSVTDSEGWHVAVVGSQRVGHDWETEQNRTECRFVMSFLPRREHLLFS